jgi:hypothetical protein
MGLSAYRLDQVQAGTCQQMEIEAIELETPRILIGQVRDERFAGRANAAAISLIQIKALLLMPSKSSNPNR